jgi:hypothetical protein
MRLSFTIHGAPRTKKNSAQLVRRGAVGRPLLLPSPYYQAWHRVALPQAKSVRRRVLPGALAVPVNCCALIYRERNGGDAVGFYQAIADLLEDAGILVNDRLIVAWDGTRLLKDAERPRIEVLLTDAFVTRSA